MENNTGKILTGLDGMDETTTFILKNVYFYCRTKNEKYHGLVVNKLKEVYRLSGNEGNKIFWTLTKNMIKRMKEEEGLEVSL